MPVCSATWDLMVSATNAEGAVFLTMNSAHMQRGFRRIVSGSFFTGVGVILWLLVFCTWRGIYPEDEDPKNIYYVLRKYGLNHNMNLDCALGRWLTMSCP